jgi:hypothetical protein
LIGLRRVRRAQATTRLNGAGPHEPSLVRALHALGLMPTDAWPPLPLDEWRDTYETLHRYVQVVGKVKLALAQPMNHWWHVALAPTPNGLTTGVIPFDDGAFSIDFDFLGHELRIETSRGARVGLALTARPVRDFFEDVLVTLGRLGIDVRIWDVPVEIPGDTTRFRDDDQHASYDRGQVERFARVLLTSALVLQEFRARFRGKCSPVHFFWGSFDLAVTRFSGRGAPLRSEADVVTQEAYCEEVSSVGFWPGSPGIIDAAYYAYGAPAPAGLSTTAIRPAAARWEPALGEHVLPYEAVRTAAQPREALLEFCESTYEAVASLAGWDRERLESWPVAVASPRGRERAAE